MTTEPAKSFYLWVDGKHHKVPEAVYIRYRQMEAFFIGGKFSTETRIGRMCQVVNDDKDQDHFVKETYEFTQS